MKSRDPQQRFVVLAEKRVNVAIKALRQITKLADTKNYDYTEEQYRKIVQKLREETFRIEAAFEQGRDQELEFRL